jgi:hypothetical protein
MKRSGSSSRKPFNPTESAPDFLGPIVPELAPLVFPRFPSVEDLLQHAAGTQPHPLAQLADPPPRSEPTSLFDGFLGGQLEVLTQDALAHPERYDDHTRGFLDELAAGRKLETLSKGEKELLDRAVMDFAAFRPPKPPPAPPTQSKKPAPPRERSEPLDERVPQVEMPGGTLPAYWWV